MPGNSTPLHYWGGLKDDPAEEFEHRNGYLSAVLRTDGALVVIDRSRILELGSAGEFAQFGQSGSGPEEFRGLQHICSFHADTMAVYDFILGRLSIVAPGPKQVTTALVAGHGTLVDSPCLGDGTLIRQHSDGTVERFDRTGKPLDTLGKMPRVHDADGIRTNAFVVAASGHLIEGDGTTNYFTVTRLDSMTSLRVEFDEVPPQGAEDRSPTPRFEGARRSQAAESEAEARRAAASDPGYIFFDRIVAGANGDIWVRDGLATADHASSVWWTRFDANGHLGGRLEIPAPPYDSLLRDAAGRPPPPPFRPMLLQATDSTVLLLRRDSDGAVHFSEFRFRTRRGM